MFRRQIGCDDNWIKLAKSRFGLAISSTRKQTLGVHERKGGFFSIFFFITFVQIACKVPFSLVK
jgi:hypothetical protein